MLSKMSVAMVLCVTLAGLSRPAGENVRLEPADSVEGYVARLLINECPFPGEKGWVSEADTKAGMLAILWVLECRLNHVPAGYKQEHIAAQKCADVIAVITAGGERGQCDGFYQDSSGDFIHTPRVGERIDYLLKAANKGAPGRFARMLLYGQGLATAYLKGGIEEADRFAGLKEIDGKPVTGRGYGWMTNKDCYHPGGNFVRIPDEESGALGGNRFFTLRKLK